jgi:YbbR domain-containing protein
LIVQFPKHWITHNWLLKIVSLIFATMLWMTVSNEASSELGLEVPLEYRNIPPRLEVTGDMPNTVQVRLRGSSNVIRDITSRDVATTIDLSQMTTGDKIIALSPQHVRAPFGAEVIRVNPSSIRFSLERTIAKTVPVVPTILGQPPEGYEIGNVLVNPSAITVEGPESRLTKLTSIATVPVRLDQTQNDINQNADLDIRDAQVRLQDPSTVNITVEVRRKGQH